MAYRVTLVIVVAASAAALGYRSLASSSSTTAPAVEAVPRTVWPAHGQAAFVESGESQVHAGPNQHAAPIASVAKVMTAYLVLRDQPLLPGDDGPTITLTDVDVADTNRRRGQEESLVPIVAGERLTERQALEALLLPSANNIAAVLARWDAGSLDAFVAEMNAAARALDMTHTRYTDPSGYDDATVSTAADQVRVVERAMRLPVSARIVATPSAWLPVAGLVRNTDALLGRDGFVGVKTGSDHAAGGCFAFRAVRSIDGKRTTITGVVLGQPGHDRIAAGLAAAAAMVDRIAGRSPRRPRHRRAGAVPQTAMRVAEKVPENDSSGLSAGSRISEVKVPVRVSPSSARLSVTLSVPTSPVDARSWSRNRKNASYVRFPVRFHAPWPVVSSSVPNGGPGATA